jgi:tetratricopeptide (TPR) repeat protein
MKFLRRYFHHSAFAAVGLGLLASAAHAESVLERADAKLRYENCLKLADHDPSAALDMAAKWSKGGAPAEHCTAMALVSLKRFPEAAARLDKLGRAPDLGSLRPTVFDQAGNAWMLAGEAKRAAASFSAALALSASDPDLYADLARAQAMLKQWDEVESDLNAALALAPRRADLLVLRASAREAQGKLLQAREDANTALRLNPKSAEALIQRGDIARDAGDLAAARRDFEAAVKLGGETAEAARQALSDLGSAAK